MRLEDGPTRPAGVRRAGKRGIEITIREGRNRQVRRMAEAIGNEVVSLKRVGFGPLRLGRLAEGEARRLRAPEVKRLWKDARAMSERLWGVRGAAQAAAQRRRVDPRRRPAS